MSLKKNITQRVKINFPITYGEHSISKYLFNKAVTKIKNKFNLEQRRAKELIEDIIKTMILQNKPPATLEHQIDDLSYDEWEFLRDQTIEEVLESQKIEEKQRKPWFFF